MSESKWTEATRTELVNVLAGRCAESADLWADQTAAARAGIAKALSDRDAALNCAERANKASCASYEEVRLLKDALAAQDNQVQRLKSAASAHLGQLNHWRKAFDEKEAERAKAAQEAYKLNLRVVARQKQVVRLLEHISRQDKAFAASKAKQREEAKIVAGQHLLAVKNLNDGQRHTLQAHKRFRAVVEDFLTVVTLTPLDCKAKAAVDALRAAVGWARSRALDKKDVAEELDKQVPRLKRSWWNSYIIT